MKNGKLSHNHPLPSPSLPTPTLTQPAIHQNKEKEGITKYMLQ